MTDLSIVIPALHEAENLARLLPKIREVLSGKGIDYEIIVVNGKSVDRTPEVCQHHGAQLLTQKTPGYGSALKEGFQSSRGRFILTLDADLSHDPYIILHLYEHRENAELVIASRYVKRGYASMPFSRKLLSKILNFVYVRLLSLPLHDISSGFRLYRSAVLKELHLEALHFDILEESLIKLYSGGWRIVEIPFHYRYRVEGASKAKLIKLGYHFLRTLMKMWRLRNAASCGDYDDRAFHSRIFLQRYWQRKRYEIIHSFSRRPKRMLDIGCGSSKIIQGLPQAVGLDIQKNKLRFLRHTNKLLVQGSIVTLPFKSRAFDEIICSNLIEHLPPRERLWEEMKRVLKDGGTLILATPDYSRPSWVCIEHAYDIAAPSAYGHEHITHYSLRTLREELLKRGFALRATRYVAGSELILKAQKARKELNIQ